MAVATPAQAWAAAVELGARGSYAEAESLVAPLASARDPWSSLALSLLASHQRQIGAIDERAGAVFGSIYDVFDCPKLTMSLVNAEFTKYASNTLLATLISFSNEIANLAAAVGAPLVSVFGVTEPEKTRPWGPRVRMLGSGSRWPPYDEVAAVVDGLLAT